ncbi:MAG: helix-turn-helix domain-containing protein [Ruminococcaceae bacterium]|nr:helix-turn-helix domain-containing protein [Oscillospiraceae bacterium]
MKEILFTDIRPFVRSAKKYVVKNQAYPINANYDHFLVYSLGNYCELVVNGVKYEMENCDAVIIRPGDTYHFIPCDGYASFIFVDFDYTLENCNTSFANLYDISDKFKNNKIFEKVNFSDFLLFNSTVYVKGMYAIENKLSEIVREFMLYEAYYVMKSSALMISVLADIAQALREGNQNNENKGITEKIIEYINRNFHQDLTNLSVGKIFAMHPNYINYLVKKRTGCTMHKYLLTRRNNYAIELLEQTTDPIYIISKKCGFKDSRCFTRAFKSVVGITPRAYREKKSFENPTKHMLTPAMQHYANKSLNSDFKVNTAIKKQQIDEAYNKAMQIVELNMIKFADGIPYICSDINGAYSIAHKDDMGCGYWTGIYILAYDMTSDKRYRYIFSKYIDNLCHRLYEYDYQHFSEMGLLYVPSCVSAYKIGKIEKARIAVVKAADILVASYKSKDGIYFTDKNYLNIDADKTEAIKISAMCNCSILYWAHEFTGVGYYKKVADNVTEFIIQNLISDDGTVYWDYGIAASKAEPSGITGKYARAISWGLYGLADLYRWNKDESAYKKATKILDRYMPEIMSTDISCIDSTMLSCMICAVYNIAKETNDKSFKKYICLADELLARLIKDASLEPLKKTDGLIGYSYGFKSSPNLANLSSVIGDYFYLEALIRKKKDFEILNKH